MHNNFQKCWRFFILTILQDIFYPVCLESSMLFLLWTLNNHELTAHYEVLVVKRIQNRYILCKMLREKCQYTEFFLVRIFPYSGWKRENTDQKNLHIWALVTQRNVHKPFLFNVPILYPFPTILYWFSGLFRSYKLGTLARNGQLKIP